MAFLGEPEVVSSGAVPAIRLFLLAFLKISALLTAFFFLDKERGRPAAETTRRHSLFRWIQWPIVLSLAVACGAEGYDAYLKYKDDQESGEKTRKVLTSIDGVLESVEKRSRPLFPMRLSGLLDLDLSGAEFGRLSAAKTAFVQDDYVSDDKLLVSTATKVLPPKFAEVFKTFISTDLFFMKDDGHVSISSFVSDKSEDSIELSLSLLTPTSCSGPGQNVIRMDCGWRDNTLEIPIEHPPFEQNGKSRIYSRGGIQFYSDLVGSVLIVRSCLTLPDNSSEPEVVRGLKDRVGIGQLALSVSGGDTIRLMTPTEREKAQGCEYALYRFGKTKVELDRQLDPY